MSSTSVESTPLLLTSCPTSAAISPAFPVKVKPCDGLVNQTQLSYDKGQHQQQLDPKQLAPNTSQQYLERPCKVANFLLAKYQY